MTITTHPGEAILTVSALHKQFGGLVAVDGVSFTVHERQIKAIIGPNGAGKTTLYNLISGIYGPTAGEICFRGRSLDGLRPSEIAALGVTRTFQNIRLFENMTVLENVMVGRHVRTAAGFWAAALRLPSTRREEEAITRRARELLERVGLLERASDPAGELPFGQQRALEIARALATEPALLMLDEPAAGLNQREREALVALIRQLREEGITVLLVEHDIDLVMRLADEVLVLDHGEPIADGTPEQVRNDPRVIAAYLGEEV